MLRRYAILPLATMLLTACTTQVPSPTASSVASTGVPASVSVQPSAAAGSELPLGDLAPLRPGTGAQVDAQRLAVRRGPGTSFPLVAGYRLDPATLTEVLVDEEVRLDSGYSTYISQGPLAIEGSSWYLISSLQQPGEADAHVWRWDADDNADHHDRGWVAGSTPTDTYLIPTGVMPCPDQSCGVASFPIAVAYGVGSARSGTFAAVTGLVIDWQAADPDGGTCDVALTLQPLGLTFVTTSVQGWNYGGNALEEDVLPAGGATYWLEVRSDCAWSVTVKTISA